MNTPHPPLLSRRSSGVLLHITSLPGPHGSGDLGASARHFVDWLAAAGQTLWQVLPHTPAGAGNSPYQSVSAFAGNPLMIDLDDLVQRGWLPWMPRQGFDHHRCDFGRIAPYRMQALRDAWRGFQHKAHEADWQAFHAFCDTHTHWLNDYVLFMVLDQQFGGPWTAWPHALARRDPTALATVQQDSADELGFWRFVQWRFWLQWTALRIYGRQQGVHLVGDAPIFVSHHSADVWARPHEFLLDAQGQCTDVAGVPPDYFSTTGQRWGNPLYNWPAMAANRYDWWTARMAHLFRLVDVVRLDHFRGFESYWAIPANEPTAITGRWQPGPGQAFFDTLRDRLGELPIIAEDLGLITPQVTELREACGFPGMRILHFAFGGGPDNPYLPHNHVPNTVAYTGTHDNDTTRGWWAHARAAERTSAQAYLGVHIDTEPHWSLMTATSQSVARTVIFPFQDVLGLDASHRMNTPGLAEGCWEWRFDWQQVGHLPAERLRTMTLAHGRGPHA